MATDSQTRYIGHLLQSNGLGFHSTLSYSKEIQDLPVEVASRMIGYLKEKGLKEVVEPDNIIHDLLLKLNQK